MIARLAASQVESALARQAAVALLGPRQIGKTTLALEIGKGRNSIYLDLEDPLDRAKLTDPALFFESTENHLVILDEIHRMPEIFQTLRGVIDKGKRKSKGKGRFLILGSAAIDLLRQSGESLAGRIAFVELSGLNLKELPSTIPTQQDLWLRGGFPESFLAMDDAESLDLRRDFVRTYLERDVPMFGPRIPSLTMDRLWTMLAHLQGSILNASELGRSIEVSTQTITRYIDLMGDLLLLRRLQPFHANIGKRLVKSPKVYIRDSGLVHALLGIQTSLQLAGHPIVGSSWEGFVIENLLSVAPPRTNAFFYRTVAGAEIDLLLELPNHGIWAIEIKRSLAAKISKGFYQAIADLQPARSFIVHSGPDHFPLSDSIQAIGLRALMDEIHGLRE